MHTCLSANADIKCTHSIRFNHFCVNALYKYVYGMHAYTYDIQVTGFFLSSLCEDNVSYMYYTQSDYFQYFPKDVYRCYYKMWIRNENHVMWIIKCESSCNVNHVMWITQCESYNVNPTMRIIMKCELSWNVNYHEMWIIMKCESSWNVNQFKLQLLTTQDNNMWIV